MTGSLILVRHAAVAERYVGICYGCSDVELSREGRRRSRELAEQLAVRQVTRVVHSGLSRAAYLAEALAERLGIAAECCPPLQERGFGEWELLRWSEIQIREGSDILRMVTEPDTFRPGGGETTFELRERVMSWFAGLPYDGLTVAVTHGGPIAALRGTLSGLPVDQWPALIPACGEFITVDVGQLLWK